MTLDQQMIDAIDARIAAALVRETAVGTVTAISGDNDAMVTFDGSAVPIPVKMTGEAIAMEGDRVCLKHAGRWWIIDGTLSRRWGSFASARAQMSGGTTTSGSYADTPAAVSATFTKRWAATRAWVAVKATAFATIGATEAFWGVNFSDPDQAPITTFSITSQYWTQANVRTPIADWQFAVGVPAGTYTVKLQWLRNAGTGVITVDTFDSASIVVMEVPPS